MEWAVLGGFAALLFCSIALHLPLLGALLGGFVLFFLYGLYRGRPPVQLGRMAWKGVRRVGPILFLFLLIGMTTALWRASGTIPFLIHCAAGWLSPAALPLLSFALCAGMSFLTGTSFGTAATAGTICMAMAAAMGVHPVLTAGACLSGSFFGDRCSPMSTSALLVSALTETDLFDNLRRMMASAAVPLGVTAGVYALAGWALGRGGDSGGAVLPFAGIVLHWTAVLPAVLVVLLSLARCSVAWTMALSVLCSGILCMALQGMGALELLRTALLGFTPDTPELAKLLSGGGLLSMLKPLSIVCVSSTFSGLLEGTGLLDPLKPLAHVLARKLTPFGGLLVLSVLTSLISCNQTLAILLSHTLYQEVMEDHEELALGLEDTAVVLAPLVPWSIAGAVPIASLGAPTVSLLCACYLYLIPLWRWAGALRKRALTARSA